MSVKDLERLADTLGHRLGDHNRETLEAALARVAKMLKITGSQVLMLASDRRTRAFRELMAASTVGETYFFRHPEHFALLGTIAERRAREGRPFATAWSVGCATGEEAYSLAIALGAYEPSALVVGSDISPRALEHAREGLFGARSFRDRTPDTIPELEQVGPTRWRTRNGVRRRVFFEEINIAHDALIPPPPLPPKVDVVFCRNVLLYFSRPKARTVIHELCQCLTEQGVLLLGALEGVLTPPEGFALMPDTPACVLYRAHKPAQPALKATAARPTAKRPEAKASVSEVRRAADRGDVERAIRLLGDPGDEPDRLRLAATIASDRGEPKRAAAMLRRLLLIKRDDIEALFQLALLTRSDGDIAAEQRYLNLLEQLLRGRRDDEIVSSTGLKVAYIRSVLNNVFNLEHGP